MKHKDSPVRKTKALARALISALVGVCIALATVATPVAVRAQSKGSFIRDAEIEDTIRAYSTPIFQAAGLNAKAIDVYLIAAPSLNAFVAGGMKMFLHTGLLQRADDPLQVMGVIAHESGHITGGHLAGRRKELENATTGMIASLLLGLGAAVASGRGDVGVAVLGAGQTAIVGDLLSYSRTQEGSADQAAIKYLTRAGYSPQGLLEFMRKIEDQEVLLSSSQEPYLRTHPLTRDRISVLQNAVEQHPKLRREAPTELQLKHKRMQAKLDGFLNNPRTVLERYPADSDAVPARYARAIAHYRIPDLKTALDEINALIAEYPDDPYFHELKGQVLFENGRILDALPAYQRAVELEPESALLRLGLAEVQVQADGAEHNRNAITNLQRVLDREPRNAFAWRLKGVAHGRLGETAEASLALAEYGLYRGDLGQSIFQAQRAQKLMDKHSPGWLRAQDIEREAKRRQDQRN